MSTNSQGMASVTATANSVSGTYAVGVTFGAANPLGGNNPDVFLLNNGSGLATLTATGGTPQTTNLGTLFANPLQATLLDGLGHPISGATVYFTTSDLAVTPAALTNASAVRLPLPLYRRPLAQRPGGVAFRGAPAARGIGRLGRGKERRSQRVLLVSHAVGLCAVHGTRLLQPIPAEIGRASCR